MQPIPRSFSVCRLPPGRPGWTAFAGPESSMARSAGAATPNFSASCQLTEQSTAASAARRRISQSDRGGMPPKWRTCTWSASAMAAFSALNSSASSGAEMAGAISERLTPRTVSPPLWIPRRGGI